MVIHTTLANNTIIHNVTVFFYLKQSLRLLKRDVTQLPENPLDETTDANGALRGTTDAPIQTTDAAPPPRRHPTNHWPRDEGLVKDNNPT